RCEVQIGEEGLAVADAYDLLGQRLLDLEDQLGLSPQLANVDELRARRGELLVPEAAAHARAGLHEDVVACIGEGAGARGGEGDPLLADLDLLRHADDHVVTMRALEARGKAAASGRAVSRLGNNRILLILVSSGLSLPPLRSGLP